MAVTMVDVKNYFEIENIAKFRVEWAELTDQDKADLKQGIGDGTFTY